MRKRWIAGALIVSGAITALYGQSTSSAAPSQPPAPAPAFEVADVHTSPHSNSPSVDTTVAHGRFMVHQATMSNMIAWAYGVETRQVIGGPPWLDLDRYDVVGKLPGATNYAQGRLMLRPVLEDRFHLVAHTDQRPLSAFILTALKSKMKPAADSSAPGGCEYKPTPQTNPPAPDFPVVFACHNETMEQFATFLRQTGSPYVKQPAVDRTGLTGGYDFELHWSYNPPKEGVEGTTLFDALSNQLGLKLEAGTAPLPVVLVDKVDETPTPNPPGIEKALPPLPPMSFDVATVRPSPPDAKGLNIQLRGTEVVISNATLDFLITWSWDTESRRIVSPPDFLGKDHWDIVGKFSSDEPAAAPGQGPSISFEDVQQMMKTLLADRFGLKIHTEDRPVDAWTLVAADPHMKAADPVNRTGCKTGPGPDGKDPRIANPMIGRLLYCQNITMTQFAGQLQSMASGYIKDPVIDETGIKGSFDFLLSFSTAGQLRGTPQAAKPDDASTSGTAEAATPTGGISLFDALPKEMGVKLVKTKHPEPMFILDHIDEKPTDN